MNERHTTRGQGRLAALGVGVLAVVGALLAAYLSGTFDAAPRRTAALQAGPTTSASSAASSTLPASPQVTGAPVSVAGDPFVAPSVAAPSGAPSRTTGVGARATTAAPTVAPTTQPPPVVYAIAPGVPVEVPAGDYALTVNGLMGASNSLGSIVQFLGGAGRALRTADFHAAATATTVRAPVRVTGPADVFDLRSSSGVLSAASMTLTRTSLGFVVRGQQITSPTSADVVWKGVNVVPQMTRNDVSALFSSYPKATVGRMIVREECWDPFFTGAQSSSMCNSFNYGGYSGSSAYRQRVEYIVRAVIATGRPIVLTVDQPGRDDPSYVPSSQEASVAPDQHTLGVYDQLATEFANNPLVVFETFNEPKMKRATTYPPANLTGAALWRDGGPMTVDGITWNVPGTQQIVDHIRAAGAGNLVLAMGENWGEDLVPAESNPLDGANLAYSYHAYNKGNTTVSPLLDSDVAPLFDPSGPYRYAAWLSEFGSDLTGSDGGAFETSAMNWAEAHHTGWAGWGWFPGSWNSYGLLSSYSPLTPNGKGQTLLNRL